MFVPYEGVLLELHRICRFNLAARTIANVCKPRPSFRRYFVLTPIVEFQWLNCTNQYVSNGFFDMRLTNYHIYIYIYISTPRKTNIPGTLSQVTPFWNWKKHRWKPIRVHDLGWNEMEMAVGFSFPYLEALDWNPRIGDYRAEVRFP